jgi:hypothetical protein
MSKRAERRETFRRHIESAEQQGISLRRYALDHDLCLRTLYRYRKLLRSRAASQPSPFLRIERSAPAVSASLEARLPNGIRLSIPAESPGLEQFLRALASL